LKKKSQSVNLIHIAYDIIVNPYFLDNILVIVILFLVELLLIVKKHSFAFIMGHKSSKQKKDLTNLSEEEIDRLTKNTTYSKQQIQDWHQGFLRYKEK